MKAILKERTRKLEEEVFQKVEQLILENNYESMESYFFGLITRTDINFTKIQEPAAKLLKSIFDQENFRDHQENFFKKFNAIDQSFIKRRDDVYKAVRGEEYNETESEASTIQNRRDSLDSKSTIEKLENQQTTTTTTSVKKPRIINPNVVDDEIFERFKAQPISDKYEKESLQIFLKNLGIKENDIFDAKVELLARALQENPKKVLPELQKIYEKELPDKREEASDEELLIEVFKRAIVIEEQHPTSKGDNKVALVLAKSYSENETYVTEVIGGAIKDFVKSNSSFEGVPSIKSKDEDLDTKALAWGFYLLAADREVDDKKILSAKDQILSGESDKRAEFDGLTLFFSTQMEGSQDTTKRLISLLEGHDDNYKTIAYASVLYSIANEPLDNEEIKSQVSSFLRTVGSYNKESIKKTLGDYFSEDSKPLLDLVKSAIETSTHIHPTVFTQAQSSLTTGARE